MKTITVGFDNVLAIYPFKRDVPNEFRPNKRLVALLNQWTSYGCDLYIITERKEDDLDIIHNFVHEHNLTIKAIVHVEGTDKLEALKRLNSQLHIDDDLQITVDAAINNIDTMMPPIDEENIFKEETFDIDFNNRKRAK